MMATILSVPFFYELFKHFPSYDAGTKSRVGDRFVSSFSFSFVIDNGAFSSVGVFGVAVLFEDRIQK